MFRLNKEQRVLLSEKLMDTGNIALGAMVFGQFLEGKFSMALTLGGVAIWALLLIYSVFLRGSKESKRG